MAYATQNFENGKVLTAEQLNHIESGITDVEKEIKTHVNDAANALKGRLSGPVVFADDVSPVEHNPVVKVHGKNLLSTNELYLELGDAYGGAPLYFTGEPNKQYTISADYAQMGTITRVGISVTRSDGVWVCETHATEASGKISVTFTYPDHNGAVRFGLFSNITPSPVEGAACQYTNIQLEEGPVATDYVPYIDPATIVIRKHGKNLLKSTATTQLNEGVTFTVYEDGSINANGTSSSTNPIRYICGEATLAPGRYLISGQNEGVGSSFVMYSDQNGGFQQQHSGQDSELVLTSLTTVAVCLVILEGATVSTTVRPMIRHELASDAKYEAPAMTEYIPGSDGVVPNFTSMSPNMTIVTLVNDATVDCEYTRDSNVVIDKLVSAIAALGGTV